MTTDALASSSPPRTRRLTRGLLGVCLVALVIAAGVAGWTMPPSTASLSVTPPPTTVLGAYHIHTVNSDGSGTPTEVAEAAARAGLSFVILTDHGDATRTPIAPHYHAGVLVIDAVEISTREGHLVALGLEDAAPYPVAGEARDVIEDVARLGGWSVAAHPDSPKPDLRWRGPVTDGIEWINADSEWRDDGPRRVLTVALQALLRPAPAVAGLFGPATTTLRRWDQWGRRTSVVGLAAVDAHARIGIDERAEPRAARALLEQPSYDTMFRTLAQGVWLERPLTGRARDDAQAILERMRRGRTFSLVRAFATPADFRIDVEAAQVSAVLSGAPQAELTWSRNGEVVARGPERVTTSLAAPGHYRVEARWPGVATPWIVSGGIHVPMPPRAEPAAPAERAQPSLLSPIDDGPTTVVPLTADGWTLEHHPGSTGLTSVTASGERTFEYALGPGRPGGQYAALAYPIASDSLQAVRVTARASGPMRVSVQVRLPLGTEGERWVRSVYLDGASRTVTLRLADFAPAGLVGGRRPIAARVKDLLFVVDTTNAQPGTSGRLWLQQVEVLGPRPEAGAITSGR